VKGFRDRRSFIALPFRLHKDTPWVPPLKIERYLFLSPKMNPYFKDGEAELFLARKDGRVVGASAPRSTGPTTRRTRPSRAGSVSSSSRTTFEIVKSLLAAAAEWVRERGMDICIGPADFAVNDESGIVIDGFEIAPMVRQPWHPPYYQQRCEEAGLQKAVDLNMWHVRIDHSERMRPILRRLAEEAGPKHGVEIRPMSRRKLRKELNLFAEIYNDAWRKNWGFVPYGKADLDAYAFDLQLVYDKKWFMIASVGRGDRMAITIPDINQALVKMNGRLFPSGSTTTCAATNTSIRSGSDS